VVWCSPQRKEGLVVGQEDLLSFFSRFALAGALGFLIGLERAMGARENPHAGLRDFVIFALIGAISAFVAALYDNAWLIGAGFLGFLALLLLAYWVDSRGHHETSGITTEAAAIVTFFLGVLAMEGMHALSIALAIAMLALLSQKQAINRFSSEIKFFELEAALKFLIISFIVLPILPRQSLDNLLTYSVGEVTTINQSTMELTFAPGEEQVFEPGSSLILYGDNALLGEIRIETVTEEAVAGHYSGGNAEQIDQGLALYTPLAPMFVMHMLAALKPFKVWLIVVLVSFISFVGYILVKILGSRAGIGLTGLIGGLASSTVTTLSFAKRSKELPAWNQIFAVAILLASSVMFPRLLIQIGVFNPALMRNMALPILVTGGTGVILAAFYFLRSRKQAADSAESEELSFGNPFCLKSAVTFGLVFATILMLTRLAITYLGEAWLPLVAIVSGLTDADAIAFSVSDAQRAGLITLDWASFNVVLGALSNTFMKLFLAFSLGHRGLFKHLLISFLIMGTVGIATMFLYYDLRTLI
jgi:uncharacterized membrane protein (DUF4010 family)